MQITTIIVIIIQTKRSLTSKTAITLTSTTTIIIITAILIISASMLARTATVRPQMAALAMS